MSKQDDIIRDQIFAEWDPRSWKFCLAACVAAIMIAFTPLEYGAQVGILLVVISALWVRTNDSRPTAAHLNVPVKVQIERVSWLGLYRVKVWPQSIGWQDYQGQYTHRQIIWPWQWHAMTEAQRQKLLSSMNEPTKLEAHFVCYHYLCAGRYERPANRRWYAL